jgi:hypothetical protein
VPHQLLDVTLYRKGRNVPLRIDYQDWNVVPDGLLNDTFAQHGLTRTASPERHEMTLESLNRQQNLGLISHGFA